MSKKIKNYDPERISNDDANSPNLAFEVEGAGIGPSTLYLPESSVSGQDATGIRRLVERTQSAFRRSERIAKEIEEEYTDEKAIAVAHDFFKNVYHIVVMNCLDVYVARAEGEYTDEARAEGEHLGQLERELNGQWNLSFVGQTAEDLWEVWLTNNGPKSTADFGRNLQSRLLKHVVSAAILAAEEEEPQEAFSESWHESVWRILHAQTAEGSLDHYYKSNIYREAEDLLENELKPTEMSFEGLRQVILDRVGS